MARAARARTLCFQCRRLQAWSGAELPEVRCPACGYPLILSSGEIALDAKTAQRLFRLFARREGAADEPLPGVLPKRSKTKLAAPSETPRKGKRAAR